MRVIGEEDKIDILTADSVNPHISSQDMKKGKYMSQANFFILIQSINQSIIVLCPRAGLSLQTHPLLSLHFRICIQPIYHDVVYHLVSSSAANFLPVYHSF